MTEPPQTPVEFVEHLAVVTAAIGLEVPGPELESRLNRDFASGSEWFVAATAFCRRGIAEGWLCAREAGGIKFGRPVRESAATNGMSVDVVEMDDIAGPHHSHPNGEIDLVMPVDPAAEFDGHGAGWTVYGPGSAHRPTVSGGKAIILYLLPGGAIEFTRG